MINKNHFDFNQINESSAGHKIDCFECNSWQDPRWYFQKLKERRQKQTPGNVFRKKEPRQKQHWITMKFWILYKANEYKQIYYCEMVH